MGFNLLCPPGSWNKIGEDITLYLCSVNSRPFFVVILNEYNIEYTSQKSKVTSQNCSPGLP